MYRHCLYLGVWVPDHPAVQEGDQRGGGVQRGEGAQGLHQVPQRKRSSGKTNAVS